MRIRIEHDPRNKLFRFAFVGELSDRGLLDAYAMLRWCYEQYGDARYIIDYTEVTDIPLSGETIARIVQERPIAPPTCLQVQVVPKRALHSLMRLFQFMSVESRPTFQVVHTMKDALKLIGVKSPKFFPLDIDLSEVA